MSTRTLIPPGTPTDVEQAIARLEQTMRQKPPRAPARKPAQTRRNWMFRKPTPEERAVSTRMQGGDT